MEIEDGDFVKIVGKCNRTAIRFKITETMETYIKSSKVYKVSIPDSIYGTNSAMVNSYRWDLGDLRLFRKKDGTVIEEDDLTLANRPVVETSFFKFDEKTLDI